jgi:uncharacterized protein YbjT (DUF2867 family)
MGSAAHPANWLPHLKGIDALINCIGVLQDSTWYARQTAHADGPAAPFAACGQAGIRRVIYISAIGADRETPSAFSRSKALGDEALMASRLVHADRVHKLLDVVVHPYTRSTPAARDLRRDFE